MRPEQVVDDRALLSGLSNLRSTSRPSVCGKRRKVLVKTRRSWPWFERRLPGTVTRLVGDRVNRASPCGRTCPLSRTTSQSTESRPSSASAGGPAQPAPLLPRHRRWRRRHRPGGRRRPGSRSAKRAASRSHADQARAGDCGPCRPRTRRHTATSRPTRCRPLFARAGPRCCSRFGLGADGTHDELRPGRTSSILRQRPARPRWPAWRRLWAGPSASCRRPASALCGLGGLASSGSFGILVFVVRGRCRREHRRLLGRPVPAHLAAR